MKISVVLANPQLGANIGAAARAMCNLGFLDLRLVNPRDGWPNSEAERNAAGALDIMKAVQVFSSLPDALAGSQYVLATTARPRDMVKPVFSPQRAVDKFGAKSGGSSGIEQLSVVFGAERTGLTNEELSYCHGILTLPTREDFASFNLAQSVLLVLWELKALCKDLPANAIHDADESVDADSDDLARHSDLTVFFSRFEALLAEASFFKSEESRPHVVRNIRNMLLRCEPTNQEIRTFQGIISALSGIKGDD